MSFIATAQRRAFQPLRPRLLVDAALATAGLAATLALLLHGGIVTADAWSGSLDMTAVALAACSTLPLIAWRRHALTVFIVTTVPSILLAGLGYPADVILGPTLALYLLAASRERWLRGLHGQPSSQPGFSPPIWPPQALAGKAFRESSCCTPGLLGRARGSPGSAPGCAVNRSPS